MDMLQDLWLLLKYIVLGLIQGFTEPIPISSSGHLVIFREVFGIAAEGLSFEILVNFGSLIAVCLVYREDIWRLAKNGWIYLTKKEPHTKADFQFIVYLVVATFITGIIGLLVEDYINEKLAHISVVGVALLATAVALWIIRNLRGKKNDGNITMRDAIIVGLAQSIALIPGVSRSGSTIVAAMLLGMRQETALRFSFLLYIPVSLGITILSIGDIVNDPNFDALVIPYTLAFLASLIATYYALRWFINIMARGNLKYFAYYCFGLALFVLIFLV